MNIDHHIQQTTLEKLLSNDGPVKYNDLKEGDIENSLFSYHLNKLIDRKMVEKTDDGYSLSIKGARWLNDNGVEIRQKESSRVYVALVIKNRDGLYLVGQRKGQFRSIINDYILPSIPYTNENDLNEQIERSIATFIPTGKLVEKTEFGFIQIKANYADNAIMRVLFSVSSCKTELFTPIAHELNEYGWMTQEQIVEINHPSATIMREIIHYVQDGKNTHVTPVVAG